MYVFVFNSILLIINLVLAVINLSSTNSSRRLAGIFNSFVTIIIAVVILYLFITRPTEADFEEEIVKYNNIKKEIELVSKTEDHEMRAILIPQLVIKINDMNEEILEHKTKCNSKWDGYSYSEKIGNLEPLSLYIIK